MLKSLYAGVSGMRSQQTKMDVIANNIANASTTGFKSGRVRFEDMISQIDSAAQGANNSRGGVNAQQIGMGVQVSGTDTIMTGGSLQGTGRGLDFGIQNGDNSFFIVSDSRTGDGTLQYTRDGGFFTDEEGNLVTASGMRVMGYTPTGGFEEIGDDIPELPEANNKELSSLQIPEKIGDAELQSFNIDDTGNIIGTYSDGNSYLLGRVGLANFTNPDGLEKQGGNLYNQTANSGIAQVGAPSDEGFGVIRSGFLEMSNVDLANEFTDMIVTSRAYQANSRAITTSDEMLQELLNLKR